MFTIKNLLIVIGRNLAIVLVVVLITVGAVVFLSKEITKISENVSKSHKLENDLKHRTLLLEVIDKETKLIGNNDIKIENAFVPSDNILSFINGLDVLAQKQEVKQVYHFESPILSPISGPFQVSTISYGNIINSNITGIISYLKEFEKLPFFTKINSISISSQDKNGWDNQSTLSFQATLYTKYSQ